MVKIISSKSLALAPFQDEVHDMGDYVAQFPAILGEEVRIVSRELEHGPDGRRLDFLVYDAESNQPGIVELKNTQADEKVLLQTLRYADWLRNNPDTIRYQISRQGLDVDPEDIEDTIKIYIVAPKIAPVVAELAQYISGFEFEFIQLQRFRDEAGEYISATTPLEVPNRTVAPSRTRLEYDDVAAYGQRGVSQEKLDLLEAAVERLTEICREEGWELAPRMLRRAVKFQTGGGRNVFTIVIRKRDDHLLRINLGRDFNMESVDMAESIKKAIRHKSGERGWSVPLQTEPLDKYRPLLRQAYAQVVGGT